MKKMIPLLSALAAVALLFMSCGAKDVYTPGTYLGEGQGHGGTIVVSVTVDKKAIQSIEVTENPESEFSLKPMNTLIEKAIKANSGDIDAVSGASETSAGMITAIQAALAKASTGKAGAASAKTEAAVKLEKMIRQMLSLSEQGAPVFLPQKPQPMRGAKVIVLEKMPLVGGNTNYATGGLNAAETSQQKAKGIEDSVEQFFNDTMKGGKNLNDPELVKVLASKSAETVNWLVSLGADLNDVGRMGGSSNNRTHRPTGGAGVGAHVAGVLDKVAEEVADIRTGSKVVAITADDNGVVNGVDVETAEGNLSYHSKSCHSGNRRIRRQSGKGCPFQT